MNVLAQRYSCSKKVNESADDTVMLTVLLNKSNATDLLNISFDSRKLYNENQNRLSKGKTQNNKSELSRSL
jgi:hypothetical protein